MKPTLALVGRPNVGKSALFNRLVGRRAAIVHDEYGVTRDRLAGQARWNERVFTVVDTGGMAFLDGARARHTIEAGAREQLEAAIRDADVLAMVVSVEDGVLPMDIEVARMLRRSGKPVIVAANKADHEQRRAGADEFASLGYPVYPVSALHNLGMEEWVGAALAALPDHAGEESEPERVRLAIVGRPNAGKSSLINTVLGERRLIVSDVPGTTRDSVEIPCTLRLGRSERSCMLVDTAGMRKVRRVKASVERFSVFRAEEAIRRADVAVALLDAEVGPTEQDKKILSLIAEHHKGCVLGINKWDLARGEVTEKEYLKALREELPFLAFAPFVFFSAQSGFHVAQLMQAVGRAIEHVDTTLSTGPLNRALHEAFERTPPPLIERARLKLYYAAQTGTRPVRIRLFVNNPDKAPATYKAYLMNRLRKAFPLEGAPIVLQFRSSHDR